MIARTRRDIETLRASGRHLAAVLQSVVSAVRPGVTGLELDRVAEEGIRAAGGIPVFKGYRSHPEEPPFPGSICVSVNSAVVHGIPDNRKLRDGDIVSIDIGMRHPANGGLVTDMAITVAVGDPDDEAKRLIAVTEQALQEGVASIRSGMRLGDLGHVIQSVIESNGFGVVRELVGHGVGHELHENPYVPNYGVPGSGQEIPDGAVFAVEPMATLGRPEVRLSNDGWTWETDDRSRAAHFEHTVLITKAGAEILTVVPDALSRH